MSNAAYSSNTYILYRIRHDNDIKHQFDNNPRVSSISHNDEKP